MSIHKNIIKRLLKTDFLELFIKQQTKRETKRERDIKHMHPEFYIGSLKSELHLVS